MEYKFQIDGALRRLKLGTLIPLILTVLTGLIIPDFFLRFLGFIILGVVIVSGLWNRDDWEYVKHAVEKVVHASDGTIKLKEFKINRKYLTVAPEEIKIVSVTDKKIIFKLSGKKLILRKDCLVEGDWDELRLLIVNGNSPRQ